MFVLERTGMQVVVVADFRPQDDVLARLEREPGRACDVQSLETGALALSVIEALDARCAAEPRSKIARQVIQDAEPIGKAGVRHVRREAVQTLETVIQPRVELV